MHKKIVFVQVSGRQYLLESGKIYNLDFLKTSQPGDLISFSRVLLLKFYKKIQIGKPYLKNVNIFGKILGNFRSKKLYILRFKPKKGYQKVKGHRQQYTRIKII